MVDLWGNSFFGRSGDTCDANLVSNILVDVDENK
jgi:hypothetical protein